MPNRREEHAIQKQQSVTSRCLAIVLKFENGDKCDSSVNGESFSGKDILDDFKLRNKSCYWNPALIESISSLEYLGFVYPYTLLVGGTELHLENIRTAWGRRVLKDPTNFTLQSIGDVDGINMEVIPQTQFVPLSEILCMVILDLNNKQVVATLDTIQERLNQCYQGMQIPSPPLIYDTLGTLIRERKIFHTGSGYFVVTSDTYRMPEDPTKTIPLSWLHYNPNYIPVLNANAKGLTRTISCQVTLANEPRRDGSEKSSNPADDRIVEMRQTLERDVLDRQPLTDKPRLARSLSARRPREKTAVKNDELREFRRSLSVRRQDEKEKKVEKEEKKSTEDIAVGKSSSSKSKDKGEKKSFLAKLFGKKKKKTEAAKETPKKVEYATFSDQFPPPEWSWYKEQVEKQHRIHKWMQNVPHHPHSVHHQHYDQVHPVYHRHPIHPDYQSMRLGHGPIRNDAIYGRTLPPQENHYHVPPRIRLRNNPPPPVDDDYEEIQDVDANSRLRSTLPARHHPHEVDNFRRMTDGRHTRRKERSKRMSMERKADMDYENVPMVSKYHSPAFPYHSERSPHVHSHNQQVTHPQYSSTPRVAGMWQPHHESYYPEVNTEEVYQHHSTDHKSKRKSHRKHGQSSHRHTEEHHRLPAKNTTISLSHDSGVNFIGLHTEHGNHPQDAHYRRRVQDDMSIRNNLRNDPYINSYEDLPNCNRQVVCEVEINNSPEMRTHQNEYVTVGMDSKIEKQRNSCNSDSALTFSERSCETVVKKEDKDVEDITKETSEVVLGDSGFSSPRVANDNSPEIEKQKIKSKVKELEKGSHSDLCDKNVYQKSDDSSPEMQDRLSGDKENRINMINNLKQVQGDYGLLTHVNPVSGKIPLFPQNSVNQQIPRKFSFEDDYGFL